MSRTLVSLDEYKTYKGIKNAEEDDTILQIIGNVSEFVKTYCNRTFIDYYLENKTEYKSADYNVIYPDEFPIRSITSLGISNDGGISYTNLVEGENYFIDREDDSIKTKTSDTTKFSSSSYNVNNVKIIYKGGYEDTPEDVKIACFDLIEFYREAEYIPKRVMSGATQDNQAFRLMYTTNLPAHIKRVLDMHRCVY